MEFKYWRTSNHEPKTVSIDTLEELLEFCEARCTEVIIISNSDGTVSLEIYDNYRE